MGEYIVHKAVELSACSKKLREDTTDHLWVISPKYDGCHVVFFFEDGMFIKALSRTGEVVKSMDHVGQALRWLYPADGKYAICGEAWTTGREFNVLSGMFRRQYPQPELCFVPFDRVEVNDQGELYSTLPYVARLRSLLHDRQWDCVLQPVYYTAIGTMVGAVRDASAYAKTLKSSTIAAYDGAVVARASGVYTVGAGKGGEFIKVKPLISHSVVVTAVISDLGAKTGKNTCVLCFDLAGEIQKVSTGITQDQANEWTEYPERIIDQTIEVEAMGVTVNGFLREPRFKGIRTDA